MAVHIRLSRVGAKKAPLYRVVVTDQRSPRGGRFIEKIGTYDPTGDASALVVNRERLDYWRGRGAQASHTLDCLLKAAGAAKIEAVGVSPPSPKGRPTEKSS
jgi:small subunit ribosomal protein S16